MLRSLPALALIAVALAGCSSGGGGDDPGEDPTADLGLEATDTTGVIRGVVVDLAVVPVSNVLVTLGSSQTNATTNELGAFGFQDLAPGTYFVNAQKAGYKTVQQSVVVEAGVAVPPIVKIQLLKDASTAPTFELFEFEGYLECSVVASTPLTGGAFVPCEVPFVGKIGNDNSHTTFDINGDVTWLHVSLVWDPTQAVGQNLYFNVLDNYDEYNVPTYNGGTSPLTGDANATQVAESSINKQQSFGFEVSVFGEQGFAGASYHQQFKAYIVVFHGFEPPEGYAFWRDGAPIVPF